MPASESAAWSPRACHAIAWHRKTVVQLPQEACTRLKPACRAGTVVAVVGDTMPGKADPKALTTVLAAAQEGAVRQVVLVVPQGGGAGGTGGFLGGLFGRSANPEAVCS